MTGDGELQEGQIWEGAMFAPNKKRENLNFSRFFSAKRRCYAL